MCDTNTTFTSLQLLTFNVAALRMWLGNAAEKQNGLAPRILHLPFSDSPPDSSHLAASPSLPPSLPLPLSLPHTRRDGWTARAGVLG